jgi:GNAT superfamily N-acetyltransferase
VNSRSAAFFAAERDGFSVSTDQTRLDAAAIHDFLSNESYWARGIPRAVLEKALSHSLCFGLYSGTAQIGLARVITDCATYFYLCDVYVLESVRGRGLGRWLIECVMRHPELQGLRRRSLVTADAHGLYAQFGFVSPANPERYMEKLDPDVYRRGAAK